jgi:Tfp pilus assembly protein PilN
VITKLNLATQPFRNRTLPYLAALLLLTFAVAGAIFAFAELRRTIADNELAKSDIEQMSAEVKNLKGQGERVQQELSPDQSALLIAAHQLVANKTFGWSRLFADLEQVLPGSVSVSRINVQNIFKEGDRTKAELEFGVLSRDYQGVMTMIDSMNNSGLFQAELRGQDRQKTERLTYSEYTLRLVYTSRNNYAPASDVAQTQEEQGANR